MPDIAIFSLIFSVSFLNVKVPLLKSLHDSKIFWPELMTCLSPCHSQPLHSVACQRAMPAAMPEARYTIFLTG